MNVFKALAIGAIIGFVVAEFSGCSSSSCGPNNCSGCCDATTKKCITIANQSNTDCGGSVGNVCGVCTGTESCVSGACTSTSNDAGMGCADCPAGCCGTNQLGSKTCYSGSSLDNASCGSGGMACQACASGTHCQLAANANDGTCEANPPDGGPSGGIGLPCTQNSDCAPFLGTAGVCLLTTADGGASYNGGYCTILGCGSGNGMTQGCPGNSRCWQLGGLSFNGMAPFINFYGENRTMCLEGCVSDWDCNCRGGFWSSATCNGTVDPTYVCASGNQLNATQTDFDPSKPGLGCFINLPARAGETGTSCVATDTSVTAYEMCALPPTNGGCFGYNEPDGGVYEPGQCGQICLSALADSVDGPDFWCGDGGICLPAGNGSGMILTNPQGLPLYATCNQKCSTPDSGQGECTSGYLCWGGFQLIDGGIADFGFCNPQCGPFNTATGNGVCPSGTVCDVPSGYCCTPAGAACAGDGDCCSSSCVSGHCAAVDAGSPDGGDGG